jgi:hypothetical protein
LREIIYIESHLNTVHERPIYRLVHKGRIYNVAHVGQWNIQRSLCGTMRI